MITVKQFNAFIRDYSGEDVKTAAENFIRYGHNEFQWYGNPFEEMYYGDCFEQTIGVEISEDGKIMCQVYDYATMKKLYAFEMPETRGFSDTPEIKDTEIKELDFNCAIREFIREHDGKQKVHPWMIRQFTSARDYGLPENEFTALINYVCGI